MGIWRRLRAKRNLRSIFWKRSFPVQRECSVRKYNLKHMKQNNYALMSLFYRIRFLGNLAAPVWNWWVDGNRNVKDYIVQWWDMLNGVAQELYLGASDFQYFYEKFAWSSWLCVYLEMISQEARAKVTGVIRSRMLWISRFVEQSQLTNGG